ncbi:uncharacterized protein LY89DRAFT_167423 [Mollisia scopiformis]|uniref:Uncharacterized protein n=1 Tax=Mollisia scopiformis TaxID=149040 RepID=A0A194XSI7_MOLSC|nr:uncharacterized protein LY89DRAFT_167423 [Mollisia scopiformis]KUJ23106.1 hypothetical protein LY89DRAFT_167423 [Mollisia scopiformis]
MFDANVNHPSRARRRSRSSLMQMRMQTRCELAAEITKQHQSCVLVKSRYRYRQHQKRQRPRSSPAAKLLQRCSLIPVSVPKSQFLAVLRSFITHAVPYQKMPQAGPHPLQPGRSFTVSTQRLQAPKNGGRMSLSRVAGCHQGRREGLEKVSLACLQGSGRSK